jgi:hypothetical protein
MPYSEYTPKQRRLAAMAGDPKKITQADIVEVRRSNKKFKDGGDVESLPVPMEPDEETMIKIEEERKKGSYTTANEIEGKMAGDRVKRRGDDRAVKTFRDGGMVRGCKSVQMSGKGFKGTF